MIILHCIDQHRIIMNMSMVVSTILFSMKTAVRSVNPSTALLRRASTYVSQALLLVLTCERHEVMALSCSYLSAVACSCSAICL
jgi:hypothetical protein